MPTRSCVSHSSRPSQKPAGHNKQCWNILRLGVYPEGQWPCRGLEYVEEWSIKSGLGELNRGDFEYRNFSVAAEPATDTTSRPRHSTLRFFFFFFFPRCNTDKWIYQTTFYLIRPCTLQGKTVGILPHHLSDFFFFAVNLTGRRDLRAVHKLLFKSVTAIPTSAKRLYNVVDLTNAQLSNWTAQLRWCSARQIHTRSAAGVCRLASNCPERKQRLHGFTTCQNNVHRMELACCERAQGHSGTAT